MKGFLHDNFTSGFPEFCGTCQRSGPRSYHTDFLSVVRLHRKSALSVCTGVSFQLSYCHRLPFYPSYALAFTLLLLRTYPPAYGRKTVRFVDDLKSFIRIVVFESGYK